MLLAYLKKFTLLGPDNYIVLSSLDGNLNGFTVLIFLKEYL